MNLNPIDWNNAQSLLVKLVQALSPLTVRAITPSLFLNCRFMIPRSDSYEGFSHRSSVRILSTLHAVQKEVDEWISEPLRSEEREMREMVRSRFKEKPDEISEEPKRGASVAKSALQVVRTAKKSETEELLPLTRQAKELIHQVQDAIVQLSNSEFIHEPKQEPFIQTLKKLKPKLDRIIEIMAENKEPLRKEFSLFRHALPTSLRQEIVQKMSESHREKPLPGLRDPIPSAKKTQLEVEAESFKPMQKKEEKLLINMAFLEKGKEAVLDSAPIKKNKENSAASISSHMEKIEKGETPTKIDPKSFVIPCAPIIFEPKRLSVNRKKKKRKGFWFKNESDEESSK